MRNPKKISGMGCWVTILLFILFVITVVTFLWILSFLILVLDAIIYYATLKKNCCPKCKGKECVIPINTPMGKKLMRDFASVSTPAASPDTVPEAQDKSSEGKIVYDPETHEYVRK